MPTCVRVCKKKLRPALMRSIGRRRDPIDQAAVVRVRPGRRPPARTWWGMDCGAWRGGASTIGSRAVASSGCRLPVPESSGAPWQAGKQPSMPQCARALCMNNFNTVLVAISTSIGIGVCLSLASIEALPGCMVGACVLGQYNV
jgi:hypothetical protein